DVPVLTGLPVLLDGPPPRLGARDRPRLRTPELLVDLRDDLVRRFVVDEDHAPREFGQTLPERAVPCFKFDVDQVGRSAVAEASVDHGLRCDEDRKRFTALLRFAELTRLELGDEPATLVRRKYADRRHARGLNLRTAGNGQFEVVRIDGADDLPAVEGSERPLRDAAAVPDLERGRIRRREPHRPVERAEERRELFACNWTDLHVRLRRYMGTLALASLGGRARFRLCRWFGFEHRGQEPAGVRALAGGNDFGCAAHDDVTAAVAAFRTELDDVVRRF